MVGIGILNQFCQSSKSAQVQIMALNITTRLRNCGRERKIYKVDDLKRIRSRILSLNSKAFICNIKDESQIYKGNNCDWSFLFPLRWTINHHSISLITLNCCFMVFPESGTVLTNKFCCTELFLNLIIIFAFSLAWKFMNAI